MPKQTFLPEDVLDADFPDWPTEVANDCVGGQGFVLRYALRGNPTVEVRETGQSIDAFEILVHDYKDLVIEGGMAKVPTIDHVGYAGPTREIALARAKVFLRARWGDKLVADAQRRLGRDS